MIKDQSNKTSPLPIDQKPDPALKQLKFLIGKWQLTGRTLDSDVDNISGWTTFEWLPGNFFIKSESEFDVNGFPMTSLELISYDSNRKVFPASVYSSMSGEPFAYEWAIDGETLMHAGLGARYEGTISADGNTITGGWRPDAGTPTTDGTAYDAVMTRVK